jgi:2'-hydroxyisoflavone reductase
MPAVSSAAAREGCHENAEESRGKHGGECLSHELTSLHSVRASTGSCVSENDTDAETRMTSTTRRKFIQVSAAAGGALSLGVLKSKAAEKPKPLRILILGGTGFIGPFQVKYALERGHQVTVFNRGKTHPAELPKEVEQLIGDRNGQLDALKNRKWDVAIDNPTSVPVWVGDVAQVLKGNIDRYVFISTISVYADASKANISEDAPLAPYTGADPMKESRDSIIASKFQLYGPLKALSEKEAEKWFPKQTLIIRPGLIVGPRDETDRFTYWPVRIDRGGEVMAPGDPSDPVQFIDGRDLAEWVIRMVETRETGVYNATGPAKTLGVGAMLEGIKTANNSKANFTWVNTDFLEEQKVAPWSDMPVWVPPRGEAAGMGRINIQWAVGKGLTFRPLEVTARDTLAWFKSQPPERQKLKAGITAEREAEVLAAWHKAKG